MNYFAAGHTVKILGDGQQLIRVRNKRREAPLPNDILGNATKPKSFFLKKSKPLAHLRILVKRYKFEEKPLG